ncbi:MAG TPA: family 16 glycosylhydrolase [Phototrophicaceae bacterium]|nr:family 16 glycosylhydrolase [Phototrophicaceae bacterium]
MQKRLFFSAAGLALVGLLTLTLILVVMPVSAQLDQEFVDTFENGVPFIEDEYGNGLGFVPWGNVDGNITLSALQVMPYSDLILPNQTSATTVLAIAYDVPSGGWGGFTHAFTNGKDWIGRDWSSYDALRFSLYGNNTGSQIQIDIFDNRAPDSTTDTAERYYYRVNDDYTGWKTFTIPLSEFQRRTDFQPGGAPDDGFGLNEVSGYAFGFPAGTGAMVAYLDNVILMTDEAIGDEVAMVEAAAATPEPTPEGEWALVWSDEFDGEAGAAPNENNWKCEVGGHGWGNSEFEYYTSCPANAALSGDGELIITARKEAAPDPSCWYGPCEYTSARLITQGKVEFQYGRVEARLKIPYGQGIWPAFWMLGSNFASAGWPGSGEIDIMENIGREPNTVYGTIHGPGYSGGDGIGGSIVLDAPVSDDYHVFAVEWNAQGMDWYVDDTLYKSVRNSDVGRRKWVYDQPFFILMNVAVGGGWPGNPDDTTTFPQEMRVDYVRWYQWQAK